MAHFSVRWRFPVGDYAAQKAPQQFAAEAIAVWPSARWVWPRTALWKTFYFDFYFLLLFSVFFYF